MKRDVFDSISECFSKQNTQLCVHANAFRLLFMANDLVKLFEIRKCQLWRMLLHCYTQILVSNLMMVAPATFFHFLSLRTVFTIGHLNRIFELSMSRAPDCVTSHAKKKTIHRKCLLTQNTLSGVRVPRVVANLMLFGWCQC